MSESEASFRQKTEGYNEIPQSNQRNVYAIAFEVIREPMFLLLVSCGVLYMLMGELSDALMLLGFVFVIMGITIVQERRTEHALEALRDLSSPRALVIREGVRKRIAGREVVRGDTLILSEGDRVPADAVFRKAINVYVDESLLTGEALPVRKIESTTAIETEKPGGEDSPYIYSGTMVTAGQGIAEVISIGSRTELGKIGKAIESEKFEVTPLQRETGRMVFRLALIGLLFCVIVVLIYSLTRGNTLQSWTQGTLAGIAMAMAILPEEFPVILTIFLALGAWRISRHRVLTRRMPAVETLGAATVLCTDKTGTLTLNQMTIRQICADNEIYDVLTESDTQVPEKFHSLLEFGILASKVDPFDPMDKAIRQLGSIQLAQTEHLHEKWELVHEYPLSPNLLAISQVWRSTEQDSLVIATKGAPEAIADLCHFNDHQQALLADQVSRMASLGLRVLGVSRVCLPVVDLPLEQHDFSFEFLGLIGLEDPIRPTVPAAIQECYTAGIRVIMITGDYPETARSIARQMGLLSAEKVITGIGIDSMDDAELAKRICNVNVYARVMPVQKLRLVNALKGNGEVVAMTGDGVNDAPALKAAHIGIAMGQRGTDVAREASALVLLDDDFSSIVEAVRLGRRIYGNIKKAIGYTFAIHVPIAGLSLIPVFLTDWPLLLLPVHIAFLQLIIDPACSIIFEAEEAGKNVMKIPPRATNERLFNAKIVTVSVLQGLGVLAILLVMYWLAGMLGHPQEGFKRSFVFTTLIIANLSLILTNRSWTRSIVSMFQAQNKALWWIVGCAGVMLVLVLNIPFLRILFHFESLGPMDITFCFVAGVISIVWFELYKLFRYGFKT